MLGKNLAISMSCIWNNSSGHLIWRCMFSNKRKWSSLICMHDVLSLFCMLTWMWQMEVVFLYSWKNMKYHVWRQPLLRAVEKSCWVKVLLNKNKSGRFDYMYCVYPYAVAFWKVFCKIFWKLLKSYVIALIIYRFVGILLCHRKIWICIECVYNLSKYC